MAESFSTAETELEMDIERGPNWLLVKLHPGCDSGIPAPHVADELWKLMSRHFTYRLVLELDELETLPCGMTGLYDEDRAALAAYVRAAETPDGFRAWLDRFLADDGSLRHAAE